MTAIDLGTPYEYGDGLKVTGLASGAAVTAKRLVSVQDAMATSGATKGLVPVAHASAGAEAHYWAREGAVQDAIVPLRRSGRVVCTASAAITAPAKLMVATGGKVATATDDHVVVGIALTDAADDGDDIVVDLNLPGFYLNAVTS